MSRQPGRPPLAKNDPTVTLNVRVPATQFDAAWQRARDSRQSLGEFVRHALNAAGAAPISVTKLDNKPGGS